MMLLLPPLPYASAGGGGGARSSLSAVGEVDERRQIRDFAEVPASIA